MRSGSPATPRRRTSHSSFRPSAPGWKLLAGSHERQFAGQVNSLRSDRRSPGENFHAGMYRLTHYLSVSRLNRVRGRRDTHARVQYAKEKYGPLRPFFANTNQSPDMPQCPLAHRIGKGAESVFERQGQALDLDMAIDLSRGRKKEIESSAATGNRRFPPHRRITGQGRNATRLDPFRDNLVGSRRIDAHAMIADRDDLQRITVLASGVSRIR